MTSTYSKTIIMNFNRISFKEFPRVLSRGIRGEHGSLSTSGPSVFLGEGDNPAHPSMDSISPHLASEENKFENYCLQCKLKEGSFPVHTDPSFRCLLVTNAS